MTQVMMIVGAGLAGAKAAETLRSEGFDGRVIVVGEDPHRPYERPPLSKAYLRGEAPDESIFVHDDAFASKHDIELLTGTRADGLDLGGHRLTLSDGSIMPFDGLLLATGSEPRRLPVPGAELDGVHLLRTLDDASRLRQALSRSDSVAVVGAGWIGCEVAASARQLGKAVTVVDPLPTPLFRVLGEQVGGVFAELHREHGVDLRLGVGVERLTGTAAVEAVVLSDGTTVHADLVVVGVGATPRVELGKAAGLPIHEGILADERLQAAPRVFVAGDVAEATHPFFRRRLRVEHWANALNQGQHAARNLLGGQQPYDRLPYFYSDQFDLGMEYVGHAPVWDDVVFRGDVDGRAFVAFYRHEGRVVAGIAVNVWDVVEPLKALIGSRGRPSTAALRDPSTDIAAVAQAGTGR